MSPTRRQFALGLLGAAAVPRWARATATLDGPGLRTLAAAKGLVFGTAVQRNQLEDAGFAAALRREAAILTPEFELKWSTVRPAPSEERFGAPDALADWCRREGMALRGHTLVWHEALPAWVPRFPDAAAARILMTAHIAKLVGRYAGRIQAWDVVNEAIEPKHGRSDGLRVSPWQSALGAAFIDLAFHAAAAADPAAQLYYNEYGLDFDTPEEEARRRATLSLLEGLRARGVPCHGLGIQGHLTAVGKKFNATRFSAFLDAVAALGLKIMITELDVTDHALPADPAARDAAVAAIAGDYLTVACAHPAVIGVMTWGLSDRQTWLNSSPDYRRRDGLAQRPLPLDAALQRKPLWAAIARAFDQAPDRRV
ncbi:MAG: endo-1,4-beta-xylanase [Proteobacteria bacterium]|nr:endo-1,4-beta-xylanase [Pseudomonadota bacterium]